MATYPGGIPSLGAVTSSDYPQAAHFNTPNAEVVAIATELGLNPQLIDDTVAPGASPASVAEYLDMTANAVKTMGGLGAWHRSAVPNRHVICGNGNAGTVAAGGTSYPVVYGLGMTATETSSYHVVTYQNLRVVWDTFYIELLTAQPTGGMEVRLRKHTNLGGATDFLAFVIPGGGSAGLKKYTGDGSMYGFDQAMADLTTDYPVNNFISVKFFNSPASESAKIGAWAIEGWQVG